jgi:serine/threonine protein kinase
MSSLDHAVALADETMLHEYELARVLGAGGFGVTYLALDTHLQKKGRYQRVFAK